ncbi:MAG: thiamine pyrophosphate-binding protein [Patescibacteria group bacterium]
MKNKHFLTGSETVIKAALAVGADYFFGYPITPGTELLSLWAREADREPRLGFLQTEDEVAAGFAVVGAVLSGRLAFTATAGPGTILMQDALVMAEAMRVPFVAVIIQRGGPSSGTVIYSQQEVNLAIYGGNGEGMRLVYSPSNLDELYEHTVKAFQNAWKYRFPTLVLTDGFLMKTRAGVETPEVKEKPQNKPLVKLGADVHLPNIYTFEEDLFKKVTADAKDFEAMAKKVTEAESYKTADARVLIVAHGLVGAAGKVAVDVLRAQNIKAGLFRPITLNPFPKKQLNQLAKKAKKIIVIESSLGQLERMVKANLEVARPVEHYLRPALGIEVEEIIKFVKTSVS